MPADRVRTVTWDDPMPGAKAARDMAGMEFMRALISGAYPPPPIARLMDFTNVEVSEGFAVFEVVPQEFHYNPIGMVHGGLASTLLDSAMGCAVQTLLPGGTGYTTMEISVRYVRPMTKDTGPVRCEGRVVHAGRRMATAEGRIVDGGGKLYAHGATTCLILRD